MTEPYVLGHSERELERLRVQAKLVDPITRQYLIEAGIGDGMHVLDFGSGAGDVAFLAANLVGPAGRVTGIDRSATAIAGARLRAEHLSVNNVTFHAGELSMTEFGEKFDAAIGRYVLCFQQDPVSVLRSIARLVRPGGIIVFHEPYRALMQSYPPSPTYDRACKWVTETYRQSGVDVQMGAKLYSTFLAAGLAAPTMRLQAVMGGANALEEIHLDADQAFVLAADIERLKIATARELDAGTLVERIVTELTANQGILIGRGEIGAWERI